MDLNKAITLQPMLQLCGYKSNELHTLICISEGLFK